MRAKKHPDVLICVISGNFEFLNFRHLFSSLNLNINFLHSRTEPLLRRYVLCLSLNPIILPAKQISKFTLCLLMTNFFQKILNIPFKALPGYNELFLDYIEDFQSLRQFYEYDYASQDELRKCAEHVSESYKTGRQFFRSDLTSILLDRIRISGRGKWQSVTFPC